MYVIAINNPKTGRMNRGNSGRYDTAEKAFEALRTKRLRRLGSITIYSVEEVPDWIDTDSGIRLFLREDEETKAEMIKEWKSNK